MDAPSHALLPQCRSRARTWEPRITGTIFTIIVSLLFVETSNTHRAPTIRRIAFGDFFSMLNKLDISQKKVCKTILASVFLFMHFFLKMIRHASCYVDHVTMLSPDKPDKIP